MSMILYILGALGLLAGAGTIVTGASAIHEILGAVLLVAGVSGLGFGAIVGKLEEIQKTAKTIDQNTWTAGKAIWRQLHDPTGKNPEPKADGD